MKAKLFPLLLLALSLFSVGQNSPQPESKPSPDRITINESYNGNSYSFQVDPEYDYAAAFAGGTLNLKITVTTVADGKENLKIIECVPEGKSSPITIENSRSTPQNSAGFLVTEYDYSVKIDPSADPRQYRINLRLQYGEQKIIDNFFVMRVYAKSDVKQSIVAKDEDNDSPKFFTGQSSRFRIKLRNTSSDYKITVSKITVESNPPELIEYTENAMVHGPITLGPKDEESVELNFKVEGMSFTNLVSGFGENPKLKLTVIYFDDFGRKTTDSPPPMPFKIRPPDKVLVMSMLAGVLIGGLIRFYLEFLARRRKIRRRELLKFVLYTVIFGMVVTAFALLGEVQFSFFKASGSYDKPMAIFVIGLAGAVGGLQLFVGWYNSLKPTGEADGPTEEEKPTSKEKKK